MLMVSWLVVVCSQKLTAPVSRIQQLAHHSQFSWQYYLVFYLLLLQGPSQRFQFVICGGTEVYITVDRLCSEDGAVDSVTGSCTRNF